MAKYVIPEKQSSFLSSFQAHQEAMGRRYLLGVTVPMLCKVAKMFYRRLSLGEWRRASRSLSTSTALRLGHAGLHV